MNTIKLSSRLRPACLQIIKKMNKIGILPNCTLQVDSFPSVIQCPLQMNMKTKKRFLLLDDMKEKLFLPKKPGRHAFKNQICITPYFGDIVDIETSFSPKAHDSHIFTFSEIAKKIRKSERVAGDQPYRSNKNSFCHIGMEEHWKRQLFKKFRGLVERVIAMIKGSCIIIE